MHAATARRELAELGRRYHGCGWMLGTSGNLSARVSPPGEDDQVVITASGVDKGRLTAADFVEVPVRRDAPVTFELGGPRPSAETAIHQVVYERVPTARAVLHVHTVASTLATAPAGHCTIRFTGLEMIKGWGLWDPGAVAELPVFANHADVGRIADDLATWLAAPRAAPAMLIAGHGLTAWGADLDAAHRHVEITEFLCRVEQARSP